jgi:hypothetical protein
VHRHTLMDFVQRYRRQREGRATPIHLSRVGT